MLYISGTRNMINIDGDALVYLAGFAADSRNGPFSHSAYNIKLMINKALQETEEHKYRIYLTSTDSKVNFRTKLLPSYKENRKKTCKKCGSQNLTKESYVERFVKEDSIMKRRMYNCKDCSEPVADSKPVYYNKIRNYMIEKFGAKVCEWGEADDWLAVGRPDHIATHDKDIYQVHDIGFYNLKSGKCDYWEEPIGSIEVDDKGKLRGYGFKWFCCQMLTGDATDNIPKPYKGDGPVWINKVLGPLETMQECWNMIKFYYDMTNNSSKLELMSQLLWVSRKPKQLGTIQTIEEFINENS